MENTAQQLPQPATTKVLKLYISGNVNMADHVLMLRAHTHLYALELSFSQREQPVADINAIFDAALRHPSLSALTVRGGDLPADSLKYLLEKLKANTTISKFRLSYSENDSQILASLTSLVMSNNTIDELAVDACLDDQSLQTLVASFANNRSIATLSLSPESNNDFLLSQISSLLNNGSALRSLAINFGSMAGGDPAFSTSAIVALAESLRASHELETFSIKHCGDAWFLGDDPPAVSEPEGWNLLADVVKTHPKLKSFSLIDLRLPAASLIMFADMLRMNADLACIDLSESKLDNSVVTAFANALVENHSLQHLTLNAGNPLEISSNTVDALSNMLERNASLTLLSLAHYRFDESGAGAIASALANNFMLQDFHVECGLGSWWAVEAVEIFVEKLSSNFSLVECQLGFANSTHSEDYSPDEVELIDGYCEQAQRVLERNQEIERKILSSRAGPESRQAVLDLLRPLGADQGSESDESMVSDASDELVDASEMSDVSDVSDVSSASEGSIEASEVASMPENQLAQLVAAIADRQFAAITDDSWLFYGERQVVAKNMHRNIWLQRWGCPAHHPLPLQVLAAIRLEQSGRAFSAEELPLPVVDLLRRSTNIMFIVGPGKRQADAESLEGDEPQLKRQALTTPASLFAEHVSDAASAAASSPSP